MLRIFEKGNKKPRPIFRSGKLLEYYTNILSNRKSPIDNKIVTGNVSNQAIPIFTMVPF